MPHGRKLYFGQIEYLPLQIDALRKFVKPRAFPNFYPIFHALYVVLLKLSQFAKLVSNEQPATPTCQNFCYLAAAHLLSLG